jgi:mono/diheme cytochrome c family protein
MPNTTRTLRAICICVPLVLAAACRDEQPQPIPPVPPPEVPQQPAPAPSSGASSQPAAPTEAQNGQQLFTTYCVSCHGPTGSGDGPLAASLDPRPRNFRAGEFKFDTNSDGKAGTVDDLANVIQNGAARYGGSPLMAGFPTLPQPHIRALAGYVQGLSGEASGN